MPNDLIPLDSIYFYMRGTHYDDGGMRYHGGGMYYHGECMRYHTGGIY